MRSGNGRHRRPRQAPALFVTAGVAGAGLAMPLLAAGGAQAADGATWDRVAECESGGLWSANAGNGYYGGLQLTMETWKDYGGTVLAARPDLASRSQQIDIGEKILEDQGPEAWPSCSVGAGLLPDAPDSPDVEVPDVEVPDVEVPDAEVPDVEVPDTGIPDDSGTDVPDPSETPAPPGESADEGTATPTPAPDATDEAGSDAGTPDSDPSPDTPDADGSSAPVPDASGAPDRPQAPGGSTGEGAGRHRGGPGEEQRPDADRPSRGKHGKPGSSEGDGGYLVRPGDSLSAIAAEHDVPGGWTELYESNRDTVGSDPDLILPGQRLAL